MLIFHVYSSKLQNIFYVYAPTISTPILHQSTSIPSAIVCGANNCIEGEKCCQNLTCVQKCLGQAPSEDQMFCSKTCNKTSRCECKNGGIWRLFIYITTRHIIIFWFIKKKFLRCCLYLFLYISCGSRAWSTTYL